MVRTRLTSSGLSTGGSLSGSLMCRPRRQIVGDGVTRNKNAPRHDPIGLQMLAPSSIRCS